MVNKTNNNRIFTKIKKKRFSLGNMHYIQEMEKE